MKRIIRLCIVATSVGLGACSTVGDGVSTGINTTLETAFMPIEVLAGRTPYANTRAKIKISEANGRVSEWQKVKASGDLEQVLRFYGDTPSFDIEWITENDLDRDLVWKQREAEAAYQGFLREMAGVGEFKKVYTAALTSKSDADVAQLVRYIRVQRKGDPLYAAALNNPAIRDLHDTAVFARAQRVATDAAVREYLAWYPAGEHVAAAQTLLEQIVFARAEKSGTEGSLKDYLKQYPTGLHATDVQIALGDIYAKGSGFHFLDQHRLAANYFKTAADSGSTAGASLLQDETAVIAQEEQDLDQERARQAEEEAKREQERQRQEEVAAREKAEKDKRAALLNPILDAVLSDDSKSWALNKYVDGSASVTDLISQSAKDKTFTIRGNYKLNGNQDGWLEATLKLNGEVQCLKYWDFPDQCKKMGEANPFLKGMAEAQRANASAGAGNSGSCIINFSSASFWAEMGAPSVVVGMAAADPCH